MSEAREAAPDAAQEEVLGRVSDQQLQLQWERCFSAAPRGIAIIDPEGELVSLNPALAELHGGSVGDFIGKPVTDLLVQESAEALPAHLVDADQAGCVAYESEHVRVDGMVLPVRTELASACDDDGNLLFRIGWFEDVTGQRRAEQARAHARRDFEIAFHNAPIGVAIVGLDGRFVRVNQKLCEITGYPDEELEALTFQEITYADDLELDLVHVEELLSGERSSYEMEKRYFTKQGHLIWIQLSAALVRDEDGEPVHFISQIQDISKRKRMEAHMSELAHRDAVTSLWNRRRFEEELERQISRCHRYGEQAVLIMLDLDGFKAVNDRGGHKSGDRLLRSIGRQLNERTRESDLVARIGGDEFAVLALNVSAAQGTALADELRDAIGQHHAHAGVTASVGIVHLDARAPSAGVCFGAADAAMYDAKGAGGDRVSRRAADPDEQGRA